ncbi:MAG: DUF4870 domain-containing protein [Verrucomicrobiales bacterium]|jgi:uncharacterized Tic20 family protein|nr:DUF4870 domain-containing protein [Verrucomicrobiales bacterium]
MSDQDTPPPMDDNSSDQDAPPLTESGGSGGSVIDSPPTEAPSTAGLGLGQGKLAENDEKTMGLLSHILGAVTSVVGPLIIWVIKKDESPFVNDQGKEALNFQITVLIGYVTATVISMIPVIGCVGALLYPVIGVTNLIFGILGGIEANKGVVYRYPFALRLIS